MPRSSSAWLDSGKLALNNSSHMEFRSEINVSTRLVRAKALDAPTPWPVNKRTIEASDLAIFTYLLPSTSTQCLIRTGEQSGKCTSMLSWIVHMLSWIVHIPSSLA